MRYAPLLISLVTVKLNETELTFEDLNIFSILQKLLRELAHHSLLTNVQQLVSTMVVG
jgi:hypothetical protein